MARTFWTKRSVWLLILLSLTLMNARHVVCFGISGYQKYLSPLKGWHCAHAQFYGGPSCSEYGRRVVSDYGVVQGYQLLEARLRQCAAAKSLMANNGSKEQNSEKPSQDCSQAVEGYKKTVDDCSKLHDNCEKSWSEIRVLVWVGALYLILYVIRLDFLPYEKTKSTNGSDDGKTTDDDKTNPA